MSREQIRVRVDIEQWERLKEADEGNTELLARLLRDWQQQRQTLAALREIDPNPCQALGRLLTSYELLSTAVVTIEPAAAPPMAHPPLEPQPSSTAVPEVIGGIENNGDDW